MRRRRRPTDEPSLRRRPPSGEPTWPAWVNAPPRRPFLTMTGEKLYSLWRAMQRPHPIYRPPEWRNLTPREQEPWEQQARETRRYAEIRERARVADEDAERAPDADAT